MVPSTTHLLHASPSCEFFDLANLWNGVDALTVWRLVQR
jgi:hypothetical protein